MATHYRYSYGIGCTVVDEFMTIRECINQIRSLNTSMVYLNNGTRIRINDLGTRKCDEPFSRIKWNKDGTIKTIRKIFCCIYPSDKTVGLDELKNHRNRSEGYRDYWMYNPDNKDYQYFNPEDFILPEKEMNIFIRANGRIDEYRTIQEPAYMYDDMMHLMKECDAMMND